MPRYRLVRPSRPVVRAPVLDAAQRDVVEHRGGPLLVLAGPGTGKTTTLVEAVVHRVQHDGLRPDELLVLTFSRRAAAQLRARIAARLGTTVREPSAMTFHAYAFALLRADAVVRGAPPPRLLAGPEQDVMIRELLAGDVDERTLDWPVSLLPALRTRGFASQLRDFLMRATERGLGPDDLAAFAREFGRHEWDAASRFLTEYEQVTSLRAPVAAYDPAELVAAATDLLAADATALTAQRQARRVVFVDEYQDADPAQEQLLQLLAGGGRDLVVVGDPDQSIYSFRGSDVEVIRRFGDRFRAADGSPARTIALQTSRRLPPDLLVASRRVAERLGGPVAHRNLVSAAADAPTDDAVDDPADVAPEDQRSVAVAVLGSPTREAAHIAGVMRSAHLRGGLPWSSMAVLVRTARQLGPLRRALSGAGVPVAVEVEAVPFTDEPAVRPLLWLLEVALGRRRLDVALAIDLVTGPYGGADALALRRLRRRLRLDSAARAAADTELTDTEPAVAEPADGEPADTEPNSGQLLVEALDDATRLGDLPAAVAAPARAIARILAAARTSLSEPGVTAESALWAMWSAASVAQRWVSTAVGHDPGSATADRDLDAVLALFDAASRFVDRLPSAGPEVFLDHVADQQFPADTLSPSAPTRDTVALLTAHAAKGLEWDLVVVAGVTEGVWPDLRVRDSVLGASELTHRLSGLHETPGAILSSLLADERRLFYVAVTRARRRLLVTATADEETSPSRFLDELDPLGADAATGAAASTETARPIDTSTRGLDIGSLVAHLRSVVCADPAAGTTDSTAVATAVTRREAAAHQLARLAAVGAPGADPFTWYGIAPVSDASPLAGPDETVRVSPSQVDGLLRCPLKSVLERHVGETAESVAQQTGVLIHQLGHELAQGLEPTQLRARFDELWRKVDAGEGWVAERQYRRTRAMVDRLEGWARKDRREIVDSERAFDVVIGRAQVSGRVDRLERDEAGRLVVLDLKTSSSPVRAADVNVHPQLGIYQLAVEAGAFPEGRESGGAGLVQLGAERKDAEQAQDPLAGATDPNWAATMLAEAAELVGAAVFEARPNEWCDRCTMRWCCPARPEGGQVFP
jgi:superfamily I DNA/RNA helicase/RecB family exonuclease